MADFVPSGLRRFKVFRSRNPQLVRSFPLKHFKTVSFSKVGTLLNLSRKRRRGSPFVVTSLLGLQVKKLHFLGTHV